LGLWDTAEGEEFNRLRTIPYPKTDVFLIVFYVTKARTFENAVKKVRKWRLGEKWVSSNNLRQILGFFIWFFFFFKFDGYLIFQWYPKLIEHRKDSIKIFVGFIQKKEININVTKKMDISPKRQ
jgi:GTPase SAR1 family protein